MRGTVKKRTRIKTVFRPLFGEKNQIYTFLPYPLKPHIYSLTIQDVEEEVEEEEAQDGGGKKEIV